jgi:hypothetical protein
MGVMMMMWSMMVAMITVVRDDGEYDVWVW